MKPHLQSRLTDQQMIRLHHELLAPVSVHDIMTGKDALDEMARYTLDTMIADFKPDTALLCIALCAAHIAERHAPVLPIAAVLGFEATRIAHDIGPTWLAHMDALLNDSHEQHVMDLLDKMPEDFEALADLLDATCGSLPDDSDAAILCGLLSQNAQISIAALDTAPEPALPKLQVHGNVITFPRARAR